MTIGIDRFVDWRFRVWVAGHARPQGSKRSIGRGRMIEQSRHVGAWRERVALAAVCAREGAIIEREAAVVTWVSFVLPRPVKTPKKLTPAAIRYPDLDKCLRAINDALTGIVWVDDAQVVLTLTSKSICELGEAPGVAIRAGIWPSDRISVIRTLGLAAHSREPP